MKKLAFLIVFVCLGLLSCESTSTPSTPYVPPVVVKAANLILDGNLTQGMTDYGCPKFEGFVKNTGNNTAYNCMVTVTCYSDVAKTTIIDTAKGFPADLGDIPAGVRAWFDAVAFNLSSLSQIKATSVKIEWLDR